MAHTPREEIERLIERTAAPQANPEPLPEHRDRSRLPRVYLDARRRLRERLESASET